MPTDTFPVAAAADDGTGGAFDTTYPPGAGTWGDDSDNASNALFCSKTFNGVDTYGIENSFFRFDTSTIPDNATITAANLLIYVISKQDNNGRNIVGDYYDFGGEPTVQADYASGVASPILTQDITTVTTSAVNTIALSDLTGINKTGFTGIRLVIDGTDSGLTSSNSVDIAAQEHAQQEARLEVTYDVPSAQTLAPSADSVDGTWTDSSGGTSLAAQIDETSASDTDYIRSVLGPSNAGCRVKLAAGSDPASSSGHIIHWRVGKDTTGGATIGLTVKLYQGGGDSLGEGTLIASFTRANVDALTTYDETLSGAEADSITNYADLYLEFSANQT